MTRFVLTVLSLVAAFVLLAPGQSTPASTPPARFEYLISHGLAGYEQLTWENGKLVRVVRARYKDAPKNVEHFDPSPQAWERFWKALDVAGIWKWKAEYPSPINISDAEGWSLELRHAGHSLTSRGYNNWPPEFPAFLDALDQLMKDGKEKPPPA
jgi:hypothetical protein